MHIYLAKESNALVSHCQCDEALVSFPAQLDCPWCGCGWLFSCVGCRKAFTFARGIQTDEPWESLARRDLRGRFKQDPDDLAVQRWTNTMRELLAGVEVGESYVYFDGQILPTDAVGISLDGWYARHELDFLPQVVALEDRAVIGGLLTKRDYWDANRLPHEDG
jgi:hypothetical protein